MTIGTTIQPGDIVHYTPAAIAQIAVQHRIMHTSAWYFRDADFWVQGVRGTTLDCYFRGHEDATWNDTVLIPVQAWDVHVVGHQEIPRHA